jgi:hypothetical protein
MRAGELERGENIAFSSRAVSKQRQISSQRNEFFALQEEPFVSATTSHC